MYRVVWRWHFYAGVIIAPILIFMAGTGALYIFKDEIEEWSRHELYWPVVSASNSLSLDEQIALVTRNLPLEGHLERITIFDDPNRSHEVLVHVGTNDYRRFLTHPGRNEVVAQLSGNDFFDIVLTLHRQLYAGTTGRIITELTVSWTVILLITGLFLWWPRHSKRGYWWPRWKNTPTYTRLRDLHSVSGFWLWPVLLIIAFTGLLYTFGWGSAYQYAAFHTGAYDIFFNPPRSISPAHTRAMSWEELSAIARKQCPGMTLGITVPHEPGLAIVVFASRRDGPSVREVCVLDHATGEVLQHATVGQFPLLGAWSSWNYSLHVGSVLGMPTKILWLIACLVLIVLPFTGIWMWWQRKPQGRLGLPTSVAMKLPIWLQILITLLSILMPAVGLSILVIVGIEWVIQLFNHSHHCEKTLHDVMTG